MTLEELIKELDDKHPKRKPVSISNGNARMVVQMSKLEIKVFKSLYCRENQLISKSSCG